MVELFYCWCGAEDGQISFHCAAKITCLLSYLVVGELFWTHAPVISVNSFDQQMCRSEKSFLGAVIVIWPFTLPTSRLLAICVGKCCFSVAWSKCYPIGPMLASRKSKLMKLCTQAMHSLIPSLLPANPWPMIFPLLHTHQPRCQCSPRAHIRGRGCNGLAQAMHGFTEGLYVFLLEVWDWVSHWSWMGLIILIPGQFCENDHTNVRRISVCNLQLIPIHLPQMLSWTLFDQDCSKWQTIEIYQAWKCCCLHASI